MSLTPEDVFQEMVQTGLEVLLSKRTTLTLEEVRALTEEVIVDWFMEDE